MISEPAEEALERIWACLEEKDEDFISQELQSYDQQILKELEDLNLIEYRDHEILLTSKGFEEAKSVIRRHRLAEKLLHDVLGLSGEDMETAACNFEHILGGELEESICTLLSHPEKCPHGKPIPPCECVHDGKCECTVAVKEIIEKTVLPLNNLDKGQRGEIVYVKTNKRENLNKILSIGLLPGRKIKILQNYPSYVFQMEHTQVAIDRELAQSIYLGNIEDEN